MSANTSWLKKPNAMPSRRTLILQNITTDSNSTLTMQNNESENVFKPPKRKSCMIGKDRKLMKMPQEKKISRPSMIAATNQTFKSRTLKMMESTRSMAPPPLPILPTAQVAQRSLIPAMSRRQKEPRMPRNLTVKSTPLHMSTPCEPARSILKRNNAAVVSLNKIRSAAKKVNFDALDAVGPLDESTIENFNFNLPKVTRAAMVDASTSTEQSSHTPSMLDMQESIIAEVKKIVADSEKRMIEKIMERSSGCGCATQQLESAAKALALRKFASQLDDIREVSENVTPSLEESKTPGVSGNATSENETPLSALEAPQPEVSATLPKQDVTPLTPPLEQEDEAETEYNEASTQETESEITEVVIGKSPRRRRARRKLTPPMIMADSRTRRKRSIPKYFQVFDVELSPKQKSSKSHC